MKLGPLKPTDFSRINIKLGIKSTQYYDYGLGIQGYNTMSEHFKGVVDRKTGKRRGIGRSLTKLYFTEAHYQGMDVQGFSRIIFADGSCKM